MNCKYPKVKKQTVYEIIRKADKRCKRKLLHQLFHEEIPALLQFVAGMSQTIEEEKNRIKSNWDNGLLDFDVWLSLSRLTAAKLTQYANGCTAITDYLLNSCSSAKLAALGSLPTVGVQTDSNHWPAIYRCGSLSVHCAGPVSALRGPVSLPAHCPGGSAARIAGCPVYGW